MSKPLHHPDRNQIDLSSVLDALSDPVRREIVARLARDGENRCSGFYDCATKTNLTYHLARLREAGLVQMRAEGATRIVTLRTDDIEARFPGLLPTILQAAQR